MGEILAFLSVVAIVAIVEYPWLLLIVAGAVVFVIIIIPDGGGSGGHSGGYSTYTTSDYSDVGSDVGDGNGFLWEGRCKTAYDPVVATFRNGHIFTGCNYGLSDFSVIEASYQNGFIYDGSVTNYLGTVLGRYKEGYIYQGNSTCFSDCVGRYGNGKIYRGSSMSFGDIIGTYQGDDDGAAAAALVYLLR